MRFARISLVALLVLAGAALLASCGGDDSKPAASGPASVVPADTPIYLEATLRPDGEQRTNAEALLSELGSVPLLGSQISPSDLAGQAVQAFDDAVGADVDYASDVEPWLGSMVGMAVTRFTQTPETIDGAATGDSASYVLAIETTDDQLAKDSVARIVEGEGDTQKEYDGVSYYESANGLYDTAVFDGLLVFATSDEFEGAVDAAHGGESLASSDGFTQAFAPLGEDGLGAAYVDFSKVADLSVSAGSADAAGVEKARGLFPELFEGPLAAKLAAGDGSLALDLSMPQASEDPLQIAATPQLGDASPDSYAAAGIADVGTIATSAIDRLETTGEAIGDPQLHSGVIDAALQARFGFGESDIAGAFGDGVAYATGDLGSAAGAQVDVTDDSASGVPAKLASGLKTVSSSSFSDLEVGSGKITAATGDDASQIVKPGNDKLADQDGFNSATAALGAEYPAIAYADLEPILGQLVGSLSIPDAIIGGTSPEQAITQFVASKLHSAALGVREDGSRVVLRAAVTVGG